MGRPKKLVAFLRLRGIHGIDPNQQMKHELEGLTKAPKLWSSRFLWNPLELTLDASACEETTIRPEDDILPWEDLLRGRTFDVTSATCCKALEHPTLACPQEARNGKGLMLIP
jgi:hypothetical protein